MKRILALLLALALLTGCADNAQTLAETEEQTTLEAAETVEQTTIESTVSEDFVCYYKSGNVAQIRWYMGDDESVVIPERIGDYTVTSVDRNAFVGTSVKEITYPSTITVFTGPSGASELTTINLPSETESFSIVTLNGCDKLSCINVSGNFKTVDGVVYTADGKTLVRCPPAKRGSFTVPEGVERIDEYAFCNADIEEVILPSTLTEIGEYAFYRCSSLPGVTLNEGLRVIGSNAFTATRITDIYLPKSVAEVGSTIIGWGGGKRTVSASELTEGLELLLMYETEFRDESTLTKALRIADARTDWNDVPTNKVFVDVDGDSFPEMLELLYSVYELNYYDAEQSDWCLMADIGSGLAYSEWIDLQGFADNYYHLDPYWLNVYDKERFSEEVVAEALKPALAVLDEVFDDTKQIQIAMSPFSAEPNGELSDIWRGQQIAGYPYIDAHYPDSWSVEVNGVDILRDGEVEGVSFENGILTLDNAELSSLTFSGMEHSYAKIRLIGDSVITADEEYVEYSGGSLRICGDGTLTAYGIRGVETEYTSSTLSVSDSARVYLTKPPAVGISFQDSAVQNISSVSIGDGALYCSVLHTDNISLHDNGRLECMHCEAYNDIYLSQNAVLYAEGDREYGDWYTVSSRLGITMSGNSRMEVRNGLVAAVLCNWGDITLSDNAVMDISVTDGWADCGIRLGRSLLAITLNDSAQLNVSGFITCIDAPKISINSGGLSCTACEGGQAVDLQYSQSPYADFEPGFYVDGRVTEFSTDIAVFDEDFSLMTEDEKTAIEQAESISIKVRVIDENSFEYYLDKCTEEFGFVPYGVLIEDINGDGAEEMVVHINPFNYVQVVYIKNGRLKVVDCGVMSQWGGTWYDSGKNRIVNQYFYGHTEGTLGAYEYYVYDWDGKDYVLTMHLEMESGYYEREADGVTKTDNFVYGNSYLNGEEITSERFEELHAELMQSMTADNRFDAVTSGAFETDEALKKEQEERYNAYLAEKLY